MSKHIHMIEQSGISAFKDAEMPQFTSADFPGWDSIQTEGAGVFFFLFRVAAGAEEFPLHAAPEAFLGYVAKGGGTLYAGSSEEKTDHVEFSEGDLISFDPNTQHAWKNGDAETKILFVKAL